MVKSAKKKRVDVDRVHRLLFVVVFISLIVSLGVLVARDVRPDNIGPSQLVIEEEGEE